MQVSVKDGKRVDFRSLPGGAVALPITEQSNFPEVPTGMLPRNFLLNTERVLDTVAGSEAVRPRSFWIEMRDHAAGSGLYLLYKSLQAPYTMLDRVVAQLEILVFRIAANFFLVTRGSVSKNLALKIGADLDLDLIVPRSICSKEEADWNLEHAESSVEISSISWLKNFCKIFYQRLANEAKAVEGTLTIAQEGSESFTRSVRFRCTLEGFSVDIDLFPKFISSAGAVTCVSKEMNDRRTWTNPVFLDHHQPCVELRDCHRAAVILIKFWKQDEQLRGLFDGHINYKCGTAASMITAAGTVTVSSQGNVIAYDPRRPIEFLKSYHISLALEKLLESDAVAQDQATDFNSSVLQLVADIGSYLSAAYDATSTADDEKFLFRNITGPNGALINPFKSDIPQNKRADLKKALDRLVEFVKSLLRQRSTPE